MTNSLNNAELAEQRDINNISGVAREFLHLSPLLI